MLRREFLKKSACGFGSLALTAICQEQARAAVDPQLPKEPHFTPRAKRVIFMWMQGGPSQMDLFDYKPRLEKENGEPVPFKLPMLTLLGQLLADILYAVVDPRVTYS